MGQKLPKFNKKGQCKNVNTPLNFKVFTVQGRVEKYIYTIYQKHIGTLDLDTLKKRRESLCLNFAKKCLKDDDMARLFPKKKIIHNMKLRKIQQFKVHKAKTERFKRSAIPNMQGLLNKHF